jgi:hypothetical protein
MKEVPPVQTEQTDSCCPDKIERLLLSIQNRETPLEQPEKTPPRQRQPFFVETVIPCGLF